MIRTPRLLAVAHPAAASVAALAVAVAAVGAGCGGADPKTAAAQGSFAARIGDDGEFTRTISVDFGALFQGQLATRTIALTNLGRAAIAVESIVPGAGIGSAFGKVPNREHPIVFDVAAGASIGPGEVLAVPVHLLIDAGTPLSSDLAVEASASLSATGAPEEESAVQVALTAHVVACPLSFPALDFGPIVLNQTATGSLHLVNPAPFDITVTSPGTPQSGDIDGIFAIHTPLPATVPAGGSLDLAITFHPAIARSFTARAPLSLSDTCPNAEAALAGEGRARVVTWTPDAIDCHWVPPGETTAREIRFTNAARAPALLSGAMIMPQDPETAIEDFALVAAEWGASGAAPIAPGETVTRTVVCSPTSLGLKRSALQFSLDVPGQSEGQLALSASGGGPKIVVDQEAIDFGEVAYVAGASIAQAHPVTIRNDGIAPTGQETAAGLRLGVDPTDSGTYGQPYYRVDPGNATTTADDFAFFVPSSYKGSIVPGAELQVIVQVVPKSAGDKAATLVILSNDIDQPETRIAVTAHATEAPPCHYQILTPTLDFGVVSANSPRVRNVIVENLGTDASDRCLFRGLQLQQRGPHFALQEHWDAKWIDGGDRLFIPVEFAPQSVAYTDDYQGMSATIALNISSPGSQLASIDVRGGVGFACVGLLPPSLDFGTLQPGEQSVEVLPQLVDLCGYGFSATSIALQPGTGGFTLRLPTPMPATGGLTVRPDNIQSISSGSAPNTRLFGIKFAPPQTPGRFEEAITVELWHDTHRLPLVLPVTGRVEASTRAADDYIQGGGDRVDVLWFVETGMTEDAAWRTSAFGALSTNAAAFIAHLQRSGNDFHLGVLGPCNFCSNSPWHTDTPDESGVLYSATAHPEKVLTTSTANLATKLAAKLTDWQTANPTYDNVQALAAMWHALVPPRSTSDNATFRRADARLALVVTGENNLGTFDQAPLSGSYLTDVLPTANLGEAVTLFQSIAGAPVIGRLSFAALTAQPAANGYRCGDDTRGSWQLPGDAIAGLPPRLFASHTDGYSGDFCSTSTAVWAKRLEQVADAATGLRVWFPLRSKPDLTRGAVEVYVDGAAVAANDATSGAKVWEYDAAENAVRFVLASSPTSGQKVSVRYFTAP